MTGSLSGERAAFGPGVRARPAGARGRKVYRITDEGRRQFAELLGTERGARADDARSFGLRLAFARYLPPQARLRLLERRRAQLAQRLTEVRAPLGGRAPARPLRPVPGGAHDGVDRARHLVARPADRRRAGTRHVTARAQRARQTEGPGLPAQEPRELEAVQSLQGMRQMEGETR